MEIIHRFLNRKFAIALLVLLIIIVLLLLPRDQGEQKIEPTAVQGVLDLTGWDFEIDGIVNLEGEWEFYWEQLLTSSDFSSESRLPKGQHVLVPNVWTDYQEDGEDYPGDGYATFRLRVVTQEPMDKLSLKIPTISSSCKIMIDDLTIATCGVVAENEERSVSSYAPQIADFQTNTNEFDIIVQVSNYLYDRGGMWYAMDLGTEKQITNMRDNEQSMNMLLLGVFFFMGLYHLAIYLLRPNEKLALYFAVGCLIGALRLFVIDELFILNLFPNTDIRVIIGIGYFTYYGGIAALTVYLGELYREEISRKIVHLTVWISGSFILTVLLFPVSIYTHLIRYYHFFNIVLGLYLISCVFLALWRRRDGAGLQFFGITFFVLTIFHDIFFNLFYMSEIINHANTIQFLRRQIVLIGLFVLVFVQAIVLARRFSKAFQAVENLSEKLLSLDRMKNEFLVNTSHELKTPLHGMINLSQSMLDGSTGKLNEAQQNNLSLMVSVSRRLTNLINDILDFSKLKNGEITLERRNISLQAVVKANDEVFRHIIGDRPLRLVLQIPEQLPYVYVDENRLLQILYNLIGNAIKFTEEGEIVVSAVQKAGMIEVSVSDSGIGIPHNKQEVIFESFEQVGATVSREYGGTGLGLSITKQLVELSGGQLNVESTVGVGSVFSFTLPISNQAIEETNAHPYHTVYSDFTTKITKPQASFAKDSKQKNYTILAVDDDPTNVQVIMNVFAQEPCHIIAAQNGEEALEIVESNTNIDLIIMDVMMPRLSGYEVCSKIRQRYTLFELPILLVTIKNEAEDLSSGFSAGANDFLVKPFYAHELRARAQTLIDLKKSVEEAIHSEMAFLRAQIKPHFLYNALNTIVSICPRDPQKAVELLTELSHYLRGNFDFKNTEKLISFNKEMELVESYLFIEKARFEERLNIIYDVEPEIHFLLPPLTIQPLVENAVRHGIMNQVEGGTVKISVQTDERDVVIVVEDNGVGMSDQKREELFAGGDKIKGIGLKNIQLRMKRMYGYGLDIESKSGLGTKVIIKFPKADKTNTEGR